jgi:hypothetical protein
MVDINNRRPDRITGETMTGTARVDAITTIKIISGTSRVKTTTATAARTSTGQSTDRKERKDPENRDANPMTKDIKDGHRSPL